MLILAHVLNGLAAVLENVLIVYFWILIARAVISWVSADPRNPIVRFLHNATEPVLYPVRRALPYMSGVDLSPLVVCAGIYFLRIFLVGTLYGLAARMG